MVKQPAMEPSEFTMSHEDFPALPGVPASSAAAALNSNVVGSQQAGGMTNAIGDTVSPFYISCRIWYYKQIVRIKLTANSHPVTSKQIIW